VEDVISKKHVKANVAQKPVPSPADHEYPGPLTFDWRTAELESLSPELRTYALALDELLLQKNGYVLIKGEEVVGTYDNRELAISDAIDRFGAQPVLIKQIVESEPILEIGHMIF
jgi:hypothetical protein